MEQKMNNRYTYKTLVLATSYAPELQQADLRLGQFPRTDYIELARIADCDIIDYSIYDKPTLLSAYRNYEKKLRLDFHLALSGYKKAKDYDVVLLMSEAVAIPYMMLQKAFGRRAGTVFISAQSSDRQARLVKSLGLFEGLDVASMHTNGQQDFMTRRMGVSQERLRMVRYAVDEQFFTPTGTDGDYLFTSGIANRDYATFFEAVKDLPVKVKVAAGGRFYCPRSNTPLPEVPDNVELVPRTNSNGMRELHRNAAVVVASLQPQRNDAAGCTCVLEGMCCGKAVVASGTLGMRDYIKHGETGMLVEPGNPMAMREAIRELLASEDLRKGLGASARQDCEGDLSLDSLVSGHLRSIEVAAVKKAVGN